MNKEYLSIVTQKSRIGFITRAEKDFIYLITHLQIKSFYNIVFVVEEDKKHEDFSKKKVPTTRAELVNFAFEVGSAIALPLVIFAFIGRFIDKVYGTTPLFLIIGLLLSLVSTGIIIWKKVKNFL